MKAMLLRSIAPLHEHSLERTNLPTPSPKEGEILICVSTCGVCHTELDQIEGRVAPSMIPIVPGHQIVGDVVACGSAVTRLAIGQRVGVGWIFSSCGQCPACKKGQENLCAKFRATGKDAHGGYAEFVTAGEDFAVPIPPGISDVDAAPLLCAGAVGYRSLRLTGIGGSQSLGLAGFGASGHLVLQVVRATKPGVRVAVFARSAGERALAVSLGADWTGSYDEDPPFLMDGVIDTTPVWRPILRMLEWLNPGGRLVINAIRKEDGDRSALEELDYPKHLWMEKEIKSVANVTRSDLSEFLSIAASHAIRPTVQEFPLEGANQALLELRSHKVRGAKVLRTR